MRFQNLCRACDSGNYVGCGRKPRFESGKKKLVTVSDAMELWWMINWYHRVNPATEKAFQCGEDQSGQPVFDVWSVCE